MIRIAFVMQLAGTGGIGYGGSLPVSCVVGDVFSSTTTPSLSICTAPNTWTTLGAALPTGALISITSGTCPTGYSEASDLNGVMVRGTVAANGNVGQAGGSDTATPTVASLTAAAQTFTGSQGTTSAVSAGTPAGTNSTGTVTPTGTIAWT